MYFRCGDCLATTWLDRIEPVGASESLSCADCGRNYTASPLTGLGATLGDHYRRTLKLSNDEQVDMPSAYSVVLGLMTLDHVRCLQGLARADLGKAVQAPKVAPRNEDPEESDRTETERSTEAAPLLPDLDPGFQKAVARGRLTIQEALRRGDRTAYASGLASRHGLPLEVAFEVADNRLRLKDAIRMKPPPPERVVKAYAATQVSRTQFRIVTGMCALGLAAISWNIWSMSFNPEQGQALILPAQTPPLEEQPAEPSSPHDAAQGAPRSAKLASTRVQRNDHGRIVEIEGPDPATVLIAFCESDQIAGGREPMEITQTVPEFASTRLGVFRDFRSQSAQLAIRIRHDRQTRRWVAGDGLQPIPVSPAPDLPPDAFRLSVASR